MESGDIGTSLDTWLNVKYLDIKIQREKGECAYSNRNL